MADAVVAAFDEESVSRLTGLSKSQLRYWDSTNFFSPSYAHENRRSPYSRIYSFLDVAGLRTLGILRKQHNVPLQHLRKVAERLSHLDQSLWSQQRLYVLNREVYFDEPDTGKPRGVLSGQYSCIELNSVMNDIREAVSGLRERPRSSVGQIRKHRNVAQSEPVIADTRIKVSTIMSFVDAEYSIDQILDEFPTLTREDIEAAIEYSKHAA